jgi:uncharacterized protein YqgV (UPF0045/DUF77 family)
MYIDRGHKIDTQKLSDLSSGITSSTLAIIGPNKLAVVPGVLKSLNSLAGLVADKINSNKTGLDIQAYCTLQDALEIECEKLKNEVASMEDAVAALKQQYKELGMLQFAEKKEMQLKIDQKTEEKETMYNALKATQEKLTELKQLFPDAYAVKAELDQLEEKLMAIENKFL